MFKYNEETNTITKDGRPIGGLDGVNIVLTTKLAPVHKGKLKDYLTEAGYLVNGFADLNENAVVESDSKLAEEVVEDIADVTSENGQVPASNPPSKSISDLLEIDPRYGDKTPALVEWYRDNDPAEFQRRYKGRKTHLGLIL